jgi:hypothetical protein
MNYKQNGVDVKWGWNTLGYKLIKPDWTTQSGQRNELLTRISGVIPNSCPPVGLPG